MVQGGELVRPNFWTVLLATSTRLRKSTCAREVVSTLPQSHQRILLAQCFTLKQFAESIGVKAKTERELNTALACVEADLEQHPDSLDAVGLLVSHELSGLIAALNANYNKGAMQMLMQAVNKVGQRPVSKPGR